jgi:hypothetical protein
MRVACSVLLCAHNCTLRSVATSKGSTLFHPNYLLEIHWCRHSGGLGCGRAAGTGWHPQGPTWAPNLKCRASSGPQKWASTAQNGPQKSHMVPVQVTTKQTTVFSVDLKLYHGMNNHFLCTSTSMTAHCTVHNVYAYVHTRRTVLFCSEGVAGCTRPDAPACLQSFAGKATISAFTDLYNQFITQ